jgi:hypothetical protein
MSTLLENGNNSLLLGVNPVANLALAVVFISARTQFTRVVPAGVEVGAVLYNELTKMPPMLLSSDLVPVV